ncbi:helix-turn-helix transcriptional regulator [Paenibacillus enshidis]|uniref:Helix-turn-helix transcriptional regulator n=1 Tax=Paenibacillus enshidis TaxID=1458439 RepID=A0ABV5B0A2_9BACL
MGTYDSLPFDADYICQLIYDAYQIPVCYLDASRQLAAAQPEPARIPVNPLYASLRDALDSLLNPEEPRDFPILKATAYLERYVTVRPGHADGESGCFILGPVLFYRMNEQSVTGLMADCSIPLKYKDELISYYNSVRYAGKAPLLQAGILLYSLISGRQLEMEEALSRNREYKLTVDWPEDNIYLNLADRRENVMLHNDPVLEKTMLHYIREGRKKELAEFLEEGSGFENPGVLSKKSNLRSQKNLSICAIALATRAAVDGGMPVEMAYTLSDLSIQHIEELHEVREVIRYTHECLCDFADKVRSVREKRYSRPISVCLNYIYNHIYDEISLNRLAEEAGLHPSYLSRLFREETGLSMTGYVQQAKIEEAKKLLTLTNYSLADVCSRLRFNDQSYFTKVFKKYAGVTPRVFRSQPGE